MAKTQSQVLRIGKLRVFSSSFANHRHKRRMTSMSLSVVHGSDICHHEHSARPRGLRRILTQWPDIHPCHPRFCDLCDLSLILKQLSDEILDSILSVLEKR